MQHSRRLFFHQLAGVAAAATILPSPALALGKKRPLATEHRPQVFTPFPVHKDWKPVGNFERYPLWPYSGNSKSFEHLQPEWTAFYRYTGRRGPTLESTGSGFYQIFVCSGAVEVPDPSTRGELKVYEAGDFFATWMFDTEWALMQAEEGTTLLVKRQRMPALDEYGPKELRAREQSFLSLPFLIPGRDESGLDLDVRSCFLLGNAERSISQDLTSVTMLEYFKDETVAPSHYHPHPVSHEFVYLQGGHMTPDGFYGPGDHIVSLPEVKEGPYLSCLNPLKTAYPKEWPMYVSENLIRREIQEPWPKIFDGSRDGIHGVLFVHYGPFATLARIWRPANWTILSAHELGPLG